MKQFFFLPPKRKQVEPLRFSLYVCVCVRDPLLRREEEKLDLFPHDPTSTHGRKIVQGKEEEREKKNKNKSFPNGPLEGFLESFQEFLADCFPAFSKGCFWKTIHALALLNFSSSSSNVSSSSGMVEGARKRERARDFLGINYVSYRLLN